jgi:hypothetical protein
MSYGSVQRAKKTSQTAHGLRDFWITLYKCPFICFSVTTYETIVNIYEQTLVLTPYH